MLRRSHPRLEPGRPHGLLFVPPGSRSRHAAVLLCRPALLQSLWLSSWKQESPAHGDLVFALSFRNLTAVQSAFCRWQPGDTQPQREPRAGCLCAIFTQRSGSPAVSSTLRNSQALENGCYTTQRARRELADATTT